MVTRARVEAGPAGATDAKRANPAAKLVLLRAAVLRNVRPFAEVTGAVAFVPGTSSCRLSEAHARLNGGKPTTFAAWSAGNFVCELGQHRRSSVAQLEDWASHVHRFEQRQATPVYCSCGLAVRGSDRAQGAAHVTATSKVPGTGTSNGPWRRIFPDGWPEKSRTCHSVSSGARRFRQRPPRGLGAL
jgi:hypothetical protein